MLGPCIYMLFNQDDAHVQAVPELCGLLFTVPHTSTPGQGKTSLKMRCLTTAEEQQRHGKDIEVLLLLSETSADYSMSWIGPRETKYTQVTTSWPYKQGKSQITGAHKLAMYLLGHPVQLPDTVRLFPIAYFQLFCVPRLNVLSDAMSLGRDCAA